LSTDLTLYPIAQAIKHAEAHEYHAVRAYCRADAVARTLVTLADPAIYADELKVTRLSSSKARIEFGFGTEYDFEVLRARGGWVISRFRVVHDQ